MGHCDKWKLPVVGPAPDGQPQLPGATAQRDKALLHLKSTRTGQGGVGTGCGGGGCWDRLSEVTQTETYVTLVITLERQCSFFTVALDMAAEL